MDDQALVQQLREIPNSGQRTIAGLVVERADSQHWVVNIGQHGQWCNVTRAVDLLMQRHITPPPPPVLDTGCAHRRSCR